MLIARVQRSGGQATQRWSQGEGGAPPLVKDKGVIPSLFIAFKESDRVTP